ncbi:hypothetical protein SeLEV6574_g02286 [Synchytrium endobioticum]|uniref:IC97/Casc1 N-terminal domain-containing protein n=1 Tax=Synchytrium endobioticum TaxID=286115 RepID=A0A507D8U9_9FUNG|nr:hypothetical protein SeLEV6574_g02286 [Synchytrium endobioticum]
MSAKKEAKDKAKKEKEKQKEAELLEQQRLAEEEARLAEARRREKEDRERKEREASEALFAREGPRLNDEITEVEQLLSARRAKVVATATRRKEEQEWERLAKCTNLPTWEKASDVNTYINILAETTFSTQDPSFDELIPIINEAEKVPYNCLYQIIVLPGYLEHDERPTYLKPPSKDKNTPMKRKADEGGTSRAGPSKSRKTR